jgi:NADH dehydrogenase [ubiquinone] 1 alpha subcomplex assembly factor 7
VSGHAQRTPTPLAQKLARRIAHDGPIGIADYIEACLHDPEHGYYRRQLAIGRAGDFITAPEISQVFGELIGLWCAVVWQQMRSPERLHLIELGPGRGTLMRDALRAVRLVPALSAALTVTLVESNHTLEQVQRENLRVESVPVAWASTIPAGDAPAIVIANEFVDTLAADQWIFRDGAWRTRCVGVDAAGALAFVDSAPVTGAVLAPELPPPAEGDIFQPPAAALPDLAGALVTAGEPCTGLLIDYGHDRPSFGDTLQAVAAHRYADPLAAPGEADLSLQVDFAALAAALHNAGLVSDGPVAQGEFLGRLGIVERASRLMAANPAKAAEIEASVARLIAPHGMGTRFRVLGFRSPALPPLPGLAPVDMPGNAP